MGQYMSHKCFQAVSRHCQTVIHGTMKTTDKQFTRPRAQMELPLGNRIGGSLHGSRINRNNPRCKASALVADWWFDRMRIELALAESLQAGRSVA